MSTTALGPTEAGGELSITKDGYELLYYPDVNNDALQNEGKPPVFYWLPNYVHIARKDGRENGDLMFIMIRFAGKQTSDGNIGVSPTEGSREVAGGVLGVTTTMAPPDHVLQQAQQEIISKYQGQRDYFWGIRSGVKPIFRPVIITSNVTSITSLTPNRDASVITPVATSTLITPTNGNSTQVVASNTPPPIPGKQVSFVRTAVPPMIIKKGFSTRSFGQKKDAQGNLDPWYFNMQGEGNGSIDPTGQAAFSGLMGVYPASILYQAFKQAYTPIRVCHALKVKFWAPMIEIKITGKWDRVFDHFSAAAGGRYLWFAADVKLEFNNLRISGGIDVEIKIDPTIPGGDKIQEYVDKKTEMISTKFMELAKDVIFAPPPTVPPAEAPSSGGLFGLWGGGLALKHRHDETHIDIFYHETKQIAYLRDTTVASNLQGVYDEIKKDPDAEKKYFLTVYMDDWPRKLARICKPVVNWPQPSLNWAGEPVAFVSVQVGYPNTSGEIDWVGHTFDKNDDATATWRVETTKKLAEDVKKAPPGWVPDKTYVKRRVHMLEPPDPIANPFVRMQIEDNVIDIDPGENGSLVNDITLEVRADDAAKIRVGPIGLNVTLENPGQMVEVTLQATDENGADIKKFPPQKFIWKSADQETDRFWSVYTSDMKISSYYKYQVRVIVKGSLFTKGMEWTGPWVNTIANGPLTISVPSSEDPGVVVKRDFVYNQANGTYSKPTPPPSKSLTSASKEIAYNYYSGQKEEVNPPPSAKMPLSGRMIKPRSVADDGWTEV